MGKKRFGGSLNRLSVRQVQAAPDGDHSDGGNLLDKAGRRLGWSSRAHRVPWNSDSFIRLWSAASSRSFSQWASAPEMFAELTNGCHEKSAENGVMREMSPARTIAESRSATVCPQRPRCVLTRRYMTIATLDNGDLLSHLSPCLRVRCLLASC